MRSEQEQLDSELAEAENLLRQLRWTVHRGSHDRIFQSWVRARRTHPRGVDEALVTAHFTEDGQLIVEKYALPCGKPDWIECDTAAFEGYAADGEPGLASGSHRMAATWCACGKRIHHSELRAQAFSRRVAKEAGATALQRDYSCDRSARVYHLSSKKGGRPIPGAYVVLADGWSS